MDAHRLKDPSPICQEPGSVASCTPLPWTAVMAAADQVTAPSGAPPEGRVARNRQRRIAAFLAAGQHIVTEEGIEALTMSRLASELDTAVGAVYRYFGSKGDLMAAIEERAIGELQRSHDASVEPVVAAVCPQVDEP